MRDLVRSPSVHRDRRTGAPNGRTPMCSRRAGLPPAHCPTRTRTADGQIDHTVRFALDNDYHVVLEGILARARYGQTITTLLQTHRGTSLVFYLEVSYQESLRRHATRSQAVDFGPEQMAAWYLPPKAVIPIREIAQAVSQRTGRNIVRPRRHDPQAKPVGECWTWWYTGRRRPFPLAASLAPRKSPHRGGSGAYPRPVVADQGAIGGDQPSLAVRARAVLRRSVQKVVDHFLAALVAVVIAALSGALAFAWSARIPAPFVGGGVVLVALAVMVLVLAHQREVGRLEGKIAELRGLVASMQPLGMANEINTDVVSPDVRRLRQLRQTIRADPFGGSGSPRDHDVDMLLDIVNQMQVVRPEGSATYEVILRAWRDRDERDGRSTDDLYTALGQLLALAGADLGESAAE